jgi:tRNA threonylcarbamoyladenosine biosynthesis protein TsaB
LLVAIDTATDYASLALHDGVQVQAEHTWESRRRHSVELLPRLAEALARLCAGPGDISAVAVARGPGSYTGLRVGMAAAKGLAMAQRLPIIGVPTLDVVAAAQGRAEERMCAVLQAGRDRICVATYRWSGNSWAAEESPRLTTWLELARDVEERTIFCGEIDPRGAGVLSRLRSKAILASPAARLRRAGFLAELAWDRLRRGETDDLATLSPAYLSYTA